MTDAELVSEIEAQRSLMVTVATGGPRIEEVQQEYALRRTRIAHELQRRGLDDPNPHGDLWAWHGRWSSGDMPQYRLRRIHLSEMYQPLIDAIKSGAGVVGSRVFDEPTGWDRVDRGLRAIRASLARAGAEEDFQAVGLLCRETLISLAQVVYNPALHPTEDGVQPSTTDAKRMLSAYIVKELSGSSNEGVRNHAKAALRLANDLQHHRTATFMQAALCAEASTSVVNLIAIISGRRNIAAPSPEELFSLDDLR
jgi:hypothetical protein